jgi:hypothetical protein
MFKNKFNIAPSLLSANFTKLKDEISNVEVASADLLHLDGMDVYIIVVKGFMILQSKIMTLPHSNISTFYRKLLELNDNVEDSLGAAFGINRNNEIILKMLRPTSNLTLNEFTYYLTSITHVAAKQTKELKERFND